MTIVEFVCFVAAGLVFATSCMKTMIPLRLVGITSNVTFLVYSWFAGVVPLFVLHIALLPLNIWRLMQIRALVREVRKVAVGDLPLESLLPFMSPRRAEAGELCPIPLQRTRSPAIERAAEAQESAMLGLLTVYLRIHTEPWKASLAGNFLRGFSIRATENASSSGLSPSGIG